MSSKNKTMKKRRPMSMKKVQHKQSVSNSPSANGESVSRIVKTFLELLNTVKLYHWNTLSFAQHKATDELYGKLNEHIDSFIEVLLGKTQGRIQKMEKQLDLYQFSMNEEVDFKHKIHEYRKFLIDLNRVFPSAEDSDLLNIRDEIVGDLNQFLYLMTFH